MSESDLSTAHIPGTIHDGYLRARDGLSLYFRERHLDNARAQVLLVHGVAEHYGRYRYVEKFCADRGIGFSLMDLRGHGQSEGKRIFIPSFESYLEDLDIMVRHVQSHSKRIFLVGHSLGGVIAIRYVQTRRPDFAGLITSGAALKASIVPPKPVFMLLEQVNKLYSATPVPGLVKPKQVCRDPEVVQRYISDPLVPKHLTTAFGLHALEASELALAEARGVKLPSLIMHGSADQVVDPAASQQFYQNLASADKELKLYPKLFHEIFNEPEKDQVLGHATDWILQRAQGE